MDFNKMTKNELACYIEDNSYQKLSNNQVKSLKKEKLIAMAMQIQTELEAAEKVQAQVESETIVEEPVKQEEQPSVEPEAEESVTVPEEPEQEEQPTVEESESVVEESEEESKKVFRIIVSHAKGFSDWFTVINILKFVCKNKIADGFKISVIHHSAEKSRTLEYAITDEGFVYYFDERPYIEDNADAGIMFMNKFSAGYALKGLEAAGNINLPYRIFDFNTKRFVNRDDIGGYFN